MAKYKPELSDQENMDAWISFMPGFPYRPDIDMEPHIPDTCPNKTKVKRKRIYQTMYCLCLKVATRKR